MMHLSIFCWITLLFSVTDSKVIHISGSTLDNATTPGSLQYYLCGNGSIAITQDTILLLSTSLNHTVLPGLSCVLSQLSNVTITSDLPNRVAHIFCHNASLHTRGFGFLNMSHMTLQNAHFHCCGGVMHSNSAATVNSSRIYFPSRQTAVLVFNQCHYLNVENVSVSDGYFGYAMIVINCFGISELFNLHIQDSDLYISGEQASSEDEITHSGSGLLLFYVLVPTDDIIQGENQLKVSKSTLIRNANYYVGQDDPIAVLENGGGPLPVFGAGGVTIFFNGAVQILVESCIIKSNIGDIAGGVLALSIEHTGTTSAPSLVLNGSLGQNDFHIAQNEVKKTSIYGKGAGVAFCIIPAPAVPASVHILLNHLVIVRNTNAQYGGGIYMYVSSALQVAVNAKLSKVYLFDNNAAVDGSAMFIIVNKKKGHSNSSLNVTIVGGMQESNILISKIYSLSFVKPVFKFVNVDEVSLSNYHINNNHGSAIVLVNTVLIISGLVRLQGNVARTGSVTLIGSSQIHFFSPATLSLLDNEVASAPGGIIMTETGDTDLSCPLVPLNSDEGHAMISINVNYTVRGLSAGKYFIYGDLRNCSETWLTSIIHYSIHRHIGQSHQSDLNKVSSLPNKLCICGTNGSCISTDTYQLVSYPGKATYVSMFAPDHWGKPTYVKLAHYQRHACSVEPNETADIVLYGDSCTDVPLKLLRHCSDAKHNKGLIHFISPSFSRGYALSVVTKPCPQGFVLNSAIGICVCHSLISLITGDSLTTCDASTGRIEIKYGAWLGSIQIQGEDGNNMTSFGYAPVCPTDYCTPGVTSVNMAKVDYLCQGNRTGMLCGECSKGYSMVLGSVHCQLCTSLASLLMIIVFAAAGIVLVLVLFCLHMTISSKLLGGIVFYINMTEISFRAAVLNSGGYAGRALNVVYSLFNLNMGFGVCFYNGMTSKVKTALQFAFPIYLWLIVVGLVVASKFSTNISNLISSASIQVLATLLYLSFAKLLLTVIDIFTPVAARIPHNDSTVWYVDGNVLYWSDKGHAALLAAAVMVTVLYLMPFVIWTTCGSLALMFKYFRLRRSLVDSFHGQFRIGWGWWFGARVFLLCVSYMNYAILRGSRPALLMLIQLLLLAPFCLAQAYFRPFQNKWVNVMENCILGNLTTLVFLMLYYELRGDITDSLPYVLVLLTAVIATLLLLALYHLGEVACKCTQRIKILVSIIGLKTNFRSRRIQLAENMPSSDSVLRESILDDCY